MISLTEAARIIGISLNTLVSRVERGKLRSYPNTHAANPQKGGRKVRRSDAEALRK